jgi:hypothetical protein
VARDVPVRVHARQGDDAAARAHPRREALHDLQEGTDRDRVRLLDVVRLRLEERPERGRGGVRDEDGDLGRRRIESVQHGRDLRRLAQVGLQREGRPAGGTDGALGLGGCGVVAAVVECDVEAVAREPLDDGAADAARAAGDECESHTSL